KSSHQFDVVHLKFLSWDSGPKYTALLSPSVPQSGGEGGGEEARLPGCPSLRLSPRSFFAGREGGQVTGSFSSGCFTACGCRSRVWPCLHSPAASRAAGAGLVV